MGKWTRIMYLISAWLFPVAILVQIFFISLSPDKTGDDEDESGSLNPLRPCGSLSPSRLLLCSICPGSPPAFGRSLFWMQRARDLLRACWFLQTVIE
jgi:hypothetical protein